MTSIHNYEISSLCQTQDGGTPVYAASQNGYSEIVDLLVQAGANIHLATNEVHVQYIYTHHNCFSILWGLMSD